MTEEQVARAFRWCTDATLVRGRMFGIAVIGVVLYIRARNGVLEAYLLERGWTGAWVGLETLEALAS